jgi:polyisoprenoid-binding protein YceI
MSTRTHPAHGGLLAPGAWRVVPERSTVGFEIRHLKISRVRGRFHEVDARISSGKDGAASIEARVDVASIDTGDERRDHRICDADFLDVANHPVLTFEGECPPGDRDGSAIVRGTLRIKGVSRAVELRACREGSTGRPGEVRLRAAGAVSCREFGLEWDSAFAAGGLLLDDRVTLRLDVIVAPA